MSITKFVLGLFLVSPLVWSQIMAENPLTYLMLFDFQNVLNLNNWLQLSDTVRSVGKSKATFDIYKTQTKQSAIFFSLLKPQPNGACFAGIRTSTQLNLEGYQYISFTCQATGNATRYKVVLHHNNENHEPYPSYEQIFDVNIDSDIEVKLPLNQFKPYYRGKLVPNQPELNIKNITTFGLQVAGGVYNDFKQSGVSSLEINNIIAEL